MKILVATKATQGKRTNDFSFATEGELVMIPVMECDGEAVDGHCGCRRAMAGMESHSATTTVKVVERDLTPRQLELLIRKSWQQAGWAKLVEARIEGYARDEAQRLIRMAQAMRLHWVYGRRGESMEFRGMDSADDAVGAGVPR